MCDPRLLTAAAEQRVVHVTFGQRRTTHQSSGASPAAWTPAHRRAGPEQDDIAATPASEPASNPEHVPVASRRAREGRIEACSLKAALSATERDEVITTKAQDAELRLLAVCDLIDTLPSYCLAFACDVPEESLQFIEADRVVAHILWVCKKWTPGTVYGARLAWTKFLVYLQALDDPHEDPSGRISLLVLTEYGAQYHAQAMANAQQRASRRRPAQPGEKDAQTGETAADKQIEGLAFLARNFGLKVPCDRVPKFRRSSGIVRRPPQAARPISLSMTIALETYVLRSDISEVMANIAGALLFCIFGGHRIRQAQCQAWFYEHGGVLFGACDDKSGDIRCRPSTYTPLNGIRSGDRWFRRLQATLQGAESGGFIFREFHSPSGKADHPLATLANAPRNHDGSPGSERAHVPRRRPPGSICQRVQEWPIVWAS